MAQFVRHDLLGNLYTHMLSHDVPIQYIKGVPTWVPTFLTPMPREYGV